MARAFVFQTIPQYVLLQVAKHKNAKDVWEAIRVQFLGADRVQKARLHTLRTELELLKMKENETVDEFSGKLSEIATKFKSLGSNLEDEVVIVASIEQYLELENMSIEEAVGRLKVYEDRIKVRDEEDNDQEKLLLTREEWEERTRRGDFDRQGRGHGQGRGRGSVGRGRGGRFQPNEDRKEQSTSQDKKHIKCYNCQEYDHYAWECLKNEPKEEALNLAQDDDDLSALL
ncbi:uncharacterized protein LOC143592779 [Bidens hawaiensis]|uniref:uncharacterized protein LOC143592779 n=1 Tax=Bidens hawaiensis TaxID=980011 RepID=UPI00404A77CC